MRPADPCPVGCGRDKRHGHLTCGPCWDQLSRPLQNEVVRAWQVYRPLLNKGPSPALTAAREAYRVARDAALGVLRERLAAERERCLCCGRRVVNANQRQPLHFDCWTEHHSDPTGAWPPDHRCGLNAGASS